MHRRQFLGVLSLGALVSLTGGVTAHEPGLDDDQFTAVPTWAGTTDARPAADGHHLSDNVKRHGRIAYLAIDTGAISYIDEPDGQWTELPTHLPGYTTANAPTDFPNGTLIFDQNRNLPAWWDTDHYEYPNFVDDVLISPVTVANTTTRTTVFDPGINANSLVQGRKYQIDLSGSFSTANTSATFTVDVNLSGATDVAGIGNVGGNVTDAPWNIEFAFTVRQHGQNGVLQPHTKGLFNGEPADSDHATVSVDTTVVTELSVDIQWDEADPDNEVVVKQAHLKQMG